jgi:DNA ligase-1
MKSLPTLYTLSKSGKTESWTIDIDAENGRYRTRHGLVGGKITTTKWFYAEPTNVGRSNERDAAAQSLFVAEAKWKKKVEAGGVENVDDAVGYKPFIEPMTAKKWKDLKGKVSFPVFCQPKFDGARAVITKHGATSRGGKSWDTVPHILEILKPVFMKYPDLVLDGELYNHEYHDNFDKIMSLVKKKKPSKADLAESKELVQFYWYDIADTSQKFSGRSDLIMRIIFEFKLEPMIKRVRTDVAHTEAMLDDLYGQYLDENYEGQMVRLDEPYEFTRSTSLMKRKEFIDDEYQIVEIFEGRGNRAGTAGRARMKLADGREFGANFKGKHEDLVAVLRNKDSYVGKWATVQSFNLTPDGIPRFPFITRFREGKGIDN